MSNNREIHEGDVGTVFQVELWNTESDTPVDVSQATEKKIIFKFSDNSIKTKTASFPLGGDGKDGIIQYISEADFLKPSGKFYWQAFIKLSTGQWRSEITDDMIQPNLNGI